MAGIEIGPLSDRLGDEELAELAGKLDKLGAPKLPAEDENGKSTTIEVDGSVLDEFLDRLEAHDIACDVYLPIEFEGRAESGEVRFGSLVALVEVLEEMKDELTPEDDDEEDEDEEDEEDEEDADDDGDAEDDYETLNLLDAKIRRLWKIMLDGAHAAIERKLPLFVVGD